MNSGTLRVSVFSPTNGRPSPGTAVSIRNSVGDIIYAGTTDREGKLPEITIPAPPEEISLTPPGSGNESPDRPYSLCDLTAVSDSGNMTEVTGIQIYSDTSALLSVILPGQSSDINIPAPSILGETEEKIPENEVKPVPPPTGSVVLPQPVVPETIIVHDGVPTDSSAKNYYIGFSDYIKNVASSEIFATWPKEALRANIIAIISFTLNRVYTEWYRGKGYNFTITSSTAFDQSFVYGRNIFSEISEIVDEIFNLYIVRQGMDQPLFAQYCDGIRVKRSGWLSQWGSKELADRGLSALSILRNYYGRDISLRAADKVEGIPVSFSGTISRGARGQNVRVIQRQLNRIADNFPLIPKLSVDGIYGPKTAGSVRTFQQIFNMPQSGTVDFATWYRISDVYVAVTGLSG